MNIYIIYTANKIAKKVGYLARIGKYLTKWTKQLIYETIIAPHYEYCLSIFLSANENDITRLQKLQNKAMRIILKCDTAWYSEDIYVKKIKLAISLSDKIKYKSLYIKLYQITIKIMCSKYCS
jgi:ABC-type transport system substrate-binding protein